MSKNYWEKLDKFEGAQKSGENPRSHPYSRSKTEFCRPIKSRERHRPASQVPLATVEGERPEMGVKKSDADRQYRHAEAIATNPPFDTDRLGYKCRWTVDLGEEYQNVTPFFKSFEVDYVNKIITMGIYEVANDDTWNWLWWLTSLRDNKGDSSLNHNIYDGGGKLLATTTYKFLKAVSHKVVYDYAQTGVAVNQIVLEYEARDRLAYQNCDPD